MGFLVIVILLYIFRGAIFRFFGWLFEKLLDLILFIGEVIDDIRGFFHKRKREKYYKQCEIERKQRLVEIDNEYAQKNYKRVIALYRDVMKDDMYSISDKMKYCHIAADSVCHIAEDVREWEEPRTWAMIIKTRNDKYAEEADELYNEITNRGGEVFKPQQTLLPTGLALLKNGEIKKAKAIFEKVWECGNFGALCVRTNLAIDIIESDTDVKDAKAWIEKLRAVDPYSAQEYEKKLKQSPYIRYQEHHKNACKYTEEAQNAQGREFINLLHKAVCEWENMYECSPDLNLAEGIVSSYVMLAEQLKEFHPDEEKQAEFYKQAYKWAGICTGGDSEKAEEMVNSIKENFNLGT